MKGWVYVLTNPCMPGIVKIGKTTRDPELRAQELYTTGVPAPFEVHFSVWTFDIDKVESSAHKRLASKRVASSREFFRSGDDAASYELIAAHEGLVNEFLNEFMYGQSMVEDDEAIAIEQINHLIKMSDIDKQEALRAISFLKKEALIDAVASMREFDLEDAPSDDEEGHYQ